MLNRKFTSSGFSCLPTDGLHAGGRTRSKMGGKYLLNQAVADYIQYLTHQNAYMPEAPSAVR
jgi:hypothetical protein